MKKTFRFSDESLNSYGFWLLSSGCDIADFLKNPIMLYNHSRAYRGDVHEMLPIGYWENVRQEKSEWLAEAVFDMDDEFAAKIAKKVENNTLRACSAGLQIIEFSEDPKYLKPGQTRPTVTKWKLREISIADLPSNRNSVALYNPDGDLLNLSEGSLQHVFTSSTLSINTPTMDELKILAAKLGLPVNANLADCTQKIGELMTDAAKVQSLQAQVDAFTAAERSRKTEEANVLLSDAIAAGRIRPEQRPQYEKLFQVDFESTKAILTAIAPVPTLSSIPESAGVSTHQLKHNGKTFSEWSKENPQVLRDLKANNPSLFKELYKSEFGVDYK